ncbi:MULTISPECIES: GNAT family protein [unclassified Aeromicrobium]|uniref:GNAT family N-acetyltransferase n=1 Tax=unclassified Aeromicrobium TaxID=2633570 RepID=UPI00288BC744|nr:MULTISPECIES: GNAT family protein [unclassified Aeromicrobium]
MPDAPDSPLLRLDWPRRTERLSLRPLTLDDVDALWAYRSDPSLHQWTGRSPASRDELVLEHFTARARGCTLVAELDGEVVGDLMVHVEDAWAQRDVAHRGRGELVVLGWTLAPRRGGQGLMTEAVEEVLRICFEDLGVHRVKAECFAANEPSWRLMERVGMRRELHAVRDSLHRDLGWVDTLGYALLADEWRAAHAIR